MPQIFKIGGYRIFFWSNEGNPSEPIHVHITTGKQSGNATKIWITRNGHCIVCNNNSHIPDKELKNIMGIIEARSLDIINNPNSCLCERFVTSVTKCLVV